MSVTRPHESPECRCEGCVAYTAEAERIRGVLAEACDRARAMLTGALDRMPDTEPAPAERRKVYYVDESTVSFDSLGDTRPFVGYAVDLPALPFPVPHDAVAVDVITGGSFVFRGEHCEACARQDRARCSVNQPKTSVSQRNGK